MIELKKHVEQIVRPIRASNWRKNRMREELLSHLTAVYEQEYSSHNNDPRAAITAARERFGNPATLTRELQATVPVLERWGCQPMPGLSRFKRRPSETIGMHLRRTLPWTVCISLGSWALLIIFCQFAGKHGSHRASLPGLIALGFGYTILLPILCYAPQLISAWIWRDMAKDASNTTLRRRTLRRIAYHYAAAAMIFSAAAFVLMLLVNRVVSFPWITTPWLVSISLIAAALALPIIWLTVVDQRRFEEWESLDLSDAIAS